MAKTIIIGVENGQYKDKDTGNIVPFIVLHLAKKNSRCCGISTEQLRLYDGNPNKAYVENAVKGDLTQLVNRYVTIERGAKGYIEDIELGDKVDDAVLIEV